MLSGVSTRSCVRCLTGILSLSLSLIQVLLELSVYFTTFIGRWVHDSVLLVRDLVLVSILVHHLRALIVWILSSFKFVKSFVELDVPHLLLHSFVCIGITWVDGPGRVSGSSSCTWAISSSCTASQFLENILTNGWVVVVRWLSIIVLANVSLRRINMGVFW